MTFVPIGVSLKLIKCLRATLIEIASRSKDEFGDEDAKRKKEEETTKKRKVAGENGVSIEFRLWRSISLFRLCEIRRSPLSFFILYYVPLLDTSARFGNTNVQKTFNFEQDYFI